MDKLEKRLQKEIQSLPPLKSRPLKISTYAADKLFKVKADIKHKEHEN